MYWGDGTLKNLDATGDIQEKYILFNDFFFIH